LYYVKKFTTQHRIGTYLHLLLPLDVFEKPLGELAQLLHRALGLILQLLVLLLETAHLVLQRQSPARLPLQTRLQIGDVVLQLRHARAGTHPKPTPSESALSVQRKLTTT
jgi:hypothetical protein